MGWKEFAADYLHFTRRDRIGVLVLLALIVLVFFLPALFFRGSAPAPPATDTSWIAVLKTAEQPIAGADAPQQPATDNPAFYQYDRPAGHTAGELFYFDPNTLPAAGWQKLGLRDKTIQIILNYRNKGGHFRQPEDLQRIYGLRPAEYERLAPFVRIDAPAAAPPFSSKAPAARPAAAYSPRTYAPIDINTADTSAFIALPGIGSKLAARIVNFREKLGGFYAIAQVAETYGLPDSTFQKIKPYLQLKNNTVRKININTATVDELKAHPYIKYSIATPLVAYRKEHGVFSRIEDIRKVAAVTEDSYSKIAPYLSLQ
ncbi:MAG: helix-hairpin-helix domain-containing protein [Chitinophagaceae bacterium]